MVTVFSAMGASSLFGAAFGLLCLCGCEASGAAFPRVAVTTPAESSNPEQSNTAAIALESFAME
jgi:hypothetical protein